MQSEIVNVIKEEPRATQAEIAEKLKVSRQSVAVNLRKLKEEGIVERIGTNREGYWKIL